MAQDLTMLTEIGRNKGVNMKFLFGDFVQVTDGFFKGIEGHVTDYSGVYNKYYFEGSIRVDSYHTRNIST